MKSHRIAGYFLISLMLGCTAACNNDKNDDSRDAPLTTAVNNATATFTSGNNITNGCVRITPGTKLSLKNDISTGEGSSLVVQIDDSSAIRLMPNSRIRIDSVSATSRILTLEQGQILVKVNKLGKKQSFKIRSGDIIAVVKGTSFRIFRDDKTTTVTVSEGKVAVFPSGTDNDLSRATVAEPGFTVQVDLSNGKKEMILRRSTAGEIRDTRKINAVPILPASEINDRKKIDSINGTINNADISIINENRTENGVEEKRGAIVKRQAASLAELKDAFNRIDEVTLYSKRIVSGIIISRGINYEMITPDGHVTFEEKDIRNIKILK